MTYCSQCYNLDEKNKSSLSRVEYWCRELHKYVSPNDRTCRYYRENPSKSISDPSCFLTTACMHKYKEDFDDNCVELLLLRWFRDKFVSSEDKSHYYEVAPKIVSALDNQEDGIVIYESIYNDVIRPCVSDIIQGKTEDAYERYKFSVLDLEQKYITPSFDEEQPVLTRKNVEAY